jgi:hypothetical protein
VHCSHPGACAYGVPFNRTVAGGSLLLAPAERVDVLFDFRRMPGRASSFIPTRRRRFHSNFERKIMTTTTRNALVCSVLALAASLAAPQASAQAFIGASLGQSDIDEGITTGLIDSGTVDAKDTGWLGHGRRHRCLIWCGSQLQLHPQSGTASRVGNVQDQRSGCDAAVHRRGLEVLSNSQPAAQTKKPGALSSPGFFV